ncbi:MAG: DEAD/DEAH box helicase [Candidatus Hodarchaeota archaeon]
MQIKEEIVDCIILIYNLEGEKPEKAMFSKKPLNWYFCQFSNQQSLDSDHESSVDKKIVLRPYRIWQTSYQKEVKKFLDPRFLKKILKNAKFTIIPKDVEDFKLNDIRTMFKDLQFNKIYRSDYCYFCRKNNSKYIHLTNDEKIPLNTELEQFLCEGCAWNNLLKRLDRKGVKVTAGLREILIDKFKKIRNIDKIVRNFEPSWNPVEDDDFSLFDVCDLIQEPYEQIHVKDLDINKDFKRILAENKVDELLPVQVKAINSGLLERQNILVASSTSSGKTLIGEIAGVSNLLSEKTGLFLFVVPLVALANQKYLEFKKKYGKLGIKVALRVGKSRIDKSLIIEDDNKNNLKNANILIGTYEGVDYLFRSGRKDNLPPVKTICIDEIQMFRDEERGTRLDGFIARLKYLYPEAQMLYLSATVANPKKLAKKLKAKLVEYFERPVPIERHLIPVLNDTEKLKLLLYLIKKEFKKKSSFGFRGQSIIFTNSRRSVHDITNALRLDHVNVDAYHSGLTYHERIRVEKRFTRQESAAVVTTAALGAGVDLPASQVIFQSLTMGIEWLTVAEFNQMVGRAGRFKKHDLGKIYLLVEPGKSYHSSQGLEEDKVALKLLTGKMQETTPPFDIDKIAGETLAFISMVGSTSLVEVSKYHEYLLNKAISVVKLLNHLHKSKLISVKDKGESITILALGKAISESFLEIEEGLKLKDKVEDYEESILDIASSVKPLKNVYVTRAIISELAKHAYGHGRFSTKFFGGTILDYMSLDSGRPGSPSLKRKKLSQFAISILSKWGTDIFNCTCGDRPYCDCGLRNLARIILHMRRIKKMEPKQISYRLREKYEIQIYAGDIYDFLDNVLHSLDAIQRFAKIIKNEDMLITITKFRNKIENP